MEVTAQYGDLCYFELPEEAAEFIGACGWRKGQTFVEVGGLGSPLPVIAAQLGLHAILYDQDQELTGEVNALAAGRLGKKVRRVSGSLQGIPDRFVNFGDYFSPDSINHLAAFGVLELQMGIDEEHTAQVESFLRDGFRALQVGGSISVNDPQKSPIYRGRQDLPGVVAKTAGECRVRLGEPREISRYSHGAIIVRRVLGKETQK